MACLAILNYLREQSCPGHTVRVNGSHGKKRSVALCLGWFLSGDCNFSDAMQPLLIGKSKPLSMLVNISLKSIKNAICNALERLSG